MKVVLNKNCYKKVKSNVQRKTMSEIGINAYVEQNPKVKISMHKVEKTSIKK